MPAALTWLGVDPGNFTSSVNWFNQQTGFIGAVPTANDDLYFVGPQLQPITVINTPFEGEGDPPLSPPTSPPPSGPAFFLPPLPFGANPNADATIPTSLLTLKSVHLVSHYTGHVSVTNGQSLGTLDLETGNLDQLGTGSNLTITTYLGFLGGTLNSTANLGDTVHITGSLDGAATANLQPLLSSSLTIGSTISLEGLGTETGGAGMGIFVGNYTTTNDADIVTGEYCCTTVGLPNLIAATIGNAFGPPYQTSRVDFSKYDVTDPKPYTIFITKAKGACDFIKDFTGSVKLLDAGSMSIAAGVSLTFYDPVDLQKNYSVSVLAGGTFSMSSSASLTGPNGMFVAGAFNTLYVPGLETESGPHRTKQTVYVSGGVYVQPTGILNMTKGAAAGQYMRLEVSGDLNVDGTLQMEMNGGMDDTRELVDCDYIYVTKALGFSETSKLVITATNATGPMRDDRKWNLAETTDGIAGTVPTPLGRYRGDKAGSNKILQATYLGVNG